MCSSEISVSKTLLKKLVSEMDMDWEIVLKEDIPNVKEDITVDPSPKDIDMEKHEESVDQRENDLETFVTKDIDKVKDEVGDKNHEELNILHKFIVKGEDNVQDFEDDIEIKEEVFYDSESGSDSDLENDPLRLSPIKNDDRCVEARFVLPFSPKKVADLWSDVSTSDTESAPTDKNIDYSEESENETDKSEDEENIDDEVSTTRGIRQRSVRRRRGSGSLRRRSSSHERSEPDDSAWSEEATMPNILPFTAVPGLLCNVPSTPLQFFQLFFTRSLLYYITSQTNKYANFRKPSTHVFSMQDIAHFLGVRMYMGIVKMSSEYEYWENSIFGSSTVKNVMSRQYYTDISRFLHFFDRRNVPVDNNDSIILIRPIVEYFQLKCKALYTPLMNLSLDEGMIPFKGRLGMKVYNPMKSDKYGIQIYYLCEATSGYVCDFSISQGVSSSIRDTVFSLLQRHLNLGYRVYMDKHYNSVSLAEELYDNGTHVCGTLRLPCNLAKTKVPRNQLNFCRKGNVFVICWQDTRLVSMITTMHNAETEPHVYSRRVKKKGKFTHEDVHLDRPVAIRDYMQYMQGVGRLDQKVKYYNFNSRSKKWTKKAFLYFLELMVVNAHILYQKYSTDVKKMSLKNFHKLISCHFMNYDGNEWPKDNDAALLPAPYRSPYAQAPTAPVPTASGLPPAPLVAATTDSGTKADDLPKPKSRKYPDSEYRLLPTGEKGLLHAPASIKNKRRRCRVCSRKKVRRDTAYFCRACGDVPLCITGPCFLAYHQRLRYWSEAGSSNN